VIPRAYWRFVLVTRRFLPLAWAYLRDRRRWLLFGGRRDVGPEMHRQRAEHLLDAILALGPTFIKLGQLLSTRPDLLPRVYVDVLSRLQDQVPPADWAEASGVLDDAVGGADAYDGFDTEPVSGASLGQVYLAELDGQRVAVKVRRPGVESLVEADLRVIRWLLPLVKRFVGKSRSFSLTNLADEFDQVIHEEMDYEREARMLTEIRENLADNDRVRIPAVMHSHSTGSVLTMEYVEGTKVTDVDGLDSMDVDRHAVAETLQRAYLRMIVDDGVFHADPHPGNIAVQRDGTVVFYDFGMSGRVSGYIQDRIVEFYIAVADRDIDGILDALTAMGTLAPDADRETMGAVMELAIADARGEDIEEYRVRGIVERIENTIYEFPFRLPANLALVLRVATVVEGVCVTLDPDYDFIAVATAYLTEQGYREEGAPRTPSERSARPRPPRCGCPPSWRASSTTWTASSSRSGRRSAIRTASSTASLPVSSTGCWPRLARSRRPSCSASAARSRPRSRPGSHSLCCTSSGGRSTTAAASPPSPNSPGRTSASGTKRRPLIRVTPSTCWTSSESGWRPLAGWSRHRLDQRLRIRVADGHADADVAELRVLNGEIEGIDRGGALPHPELEGVVVEGSETAVPNRVTNLAPLDPPGDAIQPVRGRRNGPLVGRDLGVGKQGPHGVRNPFGNLGRLDRGADSHIGPIGDPDRIVRGLWGRHSWLAPTVTTSSPAIASGPSRSSRRIRS